MHVTPIVESLDNLEVRHHAHALMLELMTMHDVLAVVLPAECIKTNQYVHGLLVVQQDRVFPPTLPREQPAAPACSRNNLEGRAMHVHRVGRVAASPEAPTLSDPERYAKVDPRHVVLLPVDAAHTVEGERAGWLRRSAQARDGRQDRRWRIDDARYTGADELHEVPSGAEATQGEALPGGQRTEIDEQIDSLAHSQVNRRSCRGRSKQSAVVTGRCCETCAACCNTPQD